MLNKNMNVYTIYITVYKYYKHYNYILLEIMKQRKTNCEKNVIETKNQAKNKIHRIEIM